MNFLQNLIIKLFLGLCWLLYVLPHFFIVCVGNLLAFLWIDLFKVRRDVIMHNLHIAFPEWSDEKSSNIARRSIYKMARGAALIFTIPFWQKKDLETRMIFHGEEHLKKALEKNKGVFLLSLHLGTGDLAAAALMMKGYPISIITKRFKNKLVDDLWFSVRSGQGVKFIEAHGKTTAFDILKVLKKNQSVCFVVDQFMGKPYGIETTFFGRKTGTAYGLALFYLKTRSPIVPIYTYLDETDKIHICFDPTLDVEPLISEDKEKSILSMTQAFNDKLEEIIRRFPEHWMWVHRRWKDFE